MLTQLHLRGRVLLVLALFAVIGATALWGQAGDGTISGTVSDPSGAAMAGAMVEFKNTSTQVVRTVITNAQGRYTVPDLGTYQIRSSFGAGRFGVAKKFGVA